MAGQKCAMGVIANDTGPFYAISTIRMAVRHGLKSASIVYCLDVHKLLQTADSDVAQWARIGAAE